jgi:uncharacterized membrane protein
MAATTPAPGRAAGEGRYEAQPEPGGWAVFAGVILAMAGAFNFIFGLTAVLNDQVLVTSGHGVLIADFTAWGWVHMCLGVLMTLAAFGLFSGANWARWTAVFFAAVNAVAQVGFLTASPIFSLIVIALDVIVIYQLTAKPWQTA